VATLHLIVGLPCAGKTTYAKRLELEVSALRFTPDEWQTRLFGQDFGLDFEHPEHNTRHELIEAIMWDVAVRVLQLGTSVILDFGFWGKSEREDYRARASSVGAYSRVHFLDVPEAELFARLEARNANLPSGTFAISASKLLEWTKVFQAPSEDELT
jgi:predicted kinase